MTPEKREAIEAVITEIDRYKGELIEKEKHPLWLAVVRLEKLCQPPRPGCRVGQWRMDGGMHAPWIHGLKASRGYQVTEPVAYCIRGVVLHVDGEFIEDEVPRSDLAEKWMQVLRWRAVALLGEGI